MAVVDSVDKSHTFPAKPVEPEPSDCCGSGCAVCVFDIYEQELRIWEKQCAAIQRGHQVECSCSALDDLMKDTYTNAKLCQVETITWNTAVYTFQLKGRHELLLCQHLVLKCINSDGQPVTRQYTPIDWCKEGSFKVLIKVYPEGKMSKCIRDWDQGDTYSWRGPFGGLQYSPNQYSHLVLVAAGTGIAPFVSLVQSVLDDEENVTMIHLLYSNKEYKDILLGSLLTEWSYFWNFSVQHFLSQESSESLGQQKRYGEHANVGRISVSHISECVRKCSLSSSSTMGAFVCGSHTFEAAMRAFFSECGVAVVQGF